MKKIFTSPHPRVRASHFVRAGGAAVPTVTPPVRRPINRLRGPGEIMLIGNWCWMNWQNRRPAAGFLLAIDEARLAVLTTT